MLPASEAQHEHSSGSGTNLPNGLGSISPDFSAMKGNVV